MKTEGRPLWLGASFPRPPESRDVIAQLRAKGIEVSLDPEIYPYGRFARFTDPEGNPIELWEPEADS